MLRRLQGVPGIAGHDPARGRFVLERVDPVRFSGQHADNGAILEQPPGRSLAHELGEIAAERDIEDGVGFGLGEGLDGGSGIDLEQRRPLLAHPFDVGALGREQVLERLDRRLAVLVVGGHRRPPVGRQFGRFLRQHRRLHIGAGPEAERIAVTLVPDEGVRERFGRDERDFISAGPRRRRPGPRWTAGFRTAPPRPRARSVRSRR